ncbi:MAG: nucleoside deaminase [Vulcanimicrobiota bacterium]
MDDLKFLRRSFELARMARNRRYGAFGAVLVRNGSVVFEAENTIAENEGDLTCHAEMNLLREASAYFSRAELGSCTMYCSTEPCAMCAGAAYWCGVGRIVYGLASNLYAQQFGGLAMNCREVFAHAPDYQVEVVGPLLQEEALAVHL